jgi:hypothetical protein
MYNSRYIYICGATQRLRDTFNPSHSCISTASYDVPLGC